MLRGFASVADVIKLKSRLFKSGRLGLTSLRWSRSMTSKPRLQATKTFDFKKCTAEETVPI
jgi:hypothetical protein